MTPSSPSLKAPAPAPPAPPAAPPRWRALLVFAAKVLVTVLIAVAFFFFLDAAADWLNDLWRGWTGSPLKPATWRVLIASVEFVAVLMLWRKVLLKDPRFQAPVLITAILAVGHAAYGILESHSSPELSRLTGGLFTAYSPAFVAILTAVVFESVVGRFFWGKWPHLASAYISGISAGILIHSPELWPYVLVVAISLASKYVLRIGDRHLWNPTNFGVTMMLFLAPASVASLSVQAGNEVWAVLVLWVLGSLIMLRLRRFHIPLAYIAAFIPLAFVRAAVTGHSWVTEIAPVTFPMFQLFIFFMITDPKTTPKRKWAQALVAVLVAVLDTVLRLGFEDVHAFYHSLFIIGPLANVIEICWDRAHARVPASAPAAAS
jgi:hypothetical protein